MLYLWVRTRHHLHLGRKRYQCYYAYLLKTCSISETATKQRGSQGFLLGMSSACMGIMLWLTWGVVLDLRGVGVGLVLLTAVVLVTPVEVSHNVACHEMNRMWKWSILFQLLQVCCNYNMEQSHISTTLVHSEFLVEGSSSTMHCLVLSYWTSAKMYHNSRWPMYMSFTMLVVASFPGSPASECKHWSCAGVESLVFFSREQPLSYRERLWLHMDIPESSEQEQERRWQEAYFIYLAIRGWISYTSSDEHIVSWTTCKTLPLFSSKNSGPISIMSCSCKKRYQALPVFILHCGVGKPGIEATLVV